MRGLGSAFKQWLIAMSVLLVCQQAGAQEAEEKDSLDEVVVTGIRASQRVAVEVKRRAENMVDAIVAEDIGKLPDVTITDSLQRVPGVQIERTAGEGTSLNIRGMPQVLTTLNGEQFLSPWSITNVQANYSDVPASMISGVDVHKSTAASMLAGGISGVVDLKTSRPFDLLPGWTAAANAELSKGSITKKDNHDFNALIGWRNDRGGFTLGGFASKTYSANYQSYSNTFYAFAREGFDPHDLNNNGNTTNDRFLIEDSYGPMAYVMERDRKGIAASFQIHINSAWQLLAEGAYTKMDQFDRGVEAKFNSDSAAQGWFGADYGALLPGSVFKYEASIPAEGDTPARDIYSTQVAHLLAPDFMSSATSRQNHTAALNTNLQLAYDNDGLFKGSARFVYAKARHDMDDAIFQEGTPNWFRDWSQPFTGSEPPAPEPYDVTVDLRGAIPTFSYFADLSNPAVLKTYQAFASAQNDKATLTAFRLDGTFKIDSGFFTTLDVGVRFGSRDVHTAQSDYMTPTAKYHSWDGSTCDSMGQNCDDSLAETPLPGYKVWQRYPDWMLFSDNPGLQSSVIVYKDFGPFRGFEGGVSTVDNRRLDDVYGFLNTVYPGVQKLPNPAKQYSVREDANSGYVQGNFKSENEVLPFSGNVGVNIVRTERRVIQNIVPVITTPTNHIGGGWKDQDSWQYLFLTSGEKVTRVSFTDVLPAININIFPRSDVIVRVAASRTMSPNDLVNVGEGLTLWYSDCDVNGASIPCAGGGNDQGNPAIKPWRADNYNASVEWYLGKDAILGLAAFYIDVKNATQTFQEQRSYPDADGVIRRSVNIWVTRDVGAAPLKGIELGYKQPFVFLPGILKNFGAEFNYTYSDSDSGDKDLTGRSMPLTSNSRHQINAVLWYQAKKLSSRVAYNWRSDVFEGRAGLNTSEAPVSLGSWAKPSGYLDASISYEFVPKVSVYVEGTNLTVTNKQVYAQFKDQFQQIFTQERRLAFGIRAKL